MRREGNKYGGHCKLSSNLCHVILLIDENVIVCTFLRVHLESTEIQVMADRFDRGDGGLVSVKRSSNGSSSARKGGQMQNLLSEFKGLYEGKLKRLDEAERAGEDINRVCYKLFSLRLS